MIRSEIQHHGDAASYVFAGSHVGMMRELFSDRRRGLLRPGRACRPAAARRRRRRRVRLGAFRGRPAAEVGPALGPAAGGFTRPPPATMLLAHMSSGSSRPRARGPPRRFGCRPLTRSCITCGTSCGRPGRRLPTSQRRVLTAIAENREGVVRGRPAPGWLARWRGAQRDRRPPDRGEIVEDAGTASGWRLVDPLARRLGQRGPPGSCRLGLGSPTRRPRRGMSFVSASARCLESPCAWRSPPAAGGTVLDSDSRPRNSCRRACKSLTRKGGVGRLPVRGKGRKGDGFNCGVKLSDGTTGKATLKIRNEEADISVIDLSATSSGANE